MIIADADRQAQITRGQGDGEATRIFAEAVGKDINFFDFYRSMQAYRVALADGQTNLVLSPNNRFLRYFETLHTAGRRRPGQPEGVDGQSIRTRCRAEGFGPRVRSGVAPASQP